MPFRYRLPWRVGRSRTRGLTDVFFMLQNSGGDKTTPRALSAQGGHTNDERQTPQVASTSSKTTCSAHRVACLLFSRPRRYQIMSSTHS